MDDITTGIDRTGVLSSLHLDSSTGGARSVCHSFRFLFLFLAGARVLSRFPLVRKHKRNLSRWFPSNVPGRPPEHANEVPAATWDHPVVQSHRCWVNNSRRPDASRSQVALAPPEGDLKHFLLSCLFERNMMKFKKKKVLNVPWVPYVKVMCEPIVSEIWSL